MTKFTSIALFALALPVAGQQKFGSLPIFVTFTDNGNTNCLSSVLQSSAPAALNPGASAWVTNTAKSTYIPCISNGTNWVLSGGSSGALSPIANDNLLANIASGSAVPIGNTLTAILDAVFGATQGSIVYRGSAGWAELTPGTTGYFLESQGTGSNPLWAPAAGSVGWQLSGTNIVTGSSLNIVPGSGVLVPCSNVSGTFTCSPAIDTSFGATNAAVIAATNTALIATGSSSGILIANLSGMLSGYTSGQYFTVQISDGPSHGSDTLNIQGVGPVALKKISAGSVVAIAANDMLLNVPYIIRYAGALGTPAFIVNLQ
jgi:hypothetical protein